MFQCVNTTAPGYLSADVRRVADVPGRKHLRSAASSSLAIPARPSTIGDGAFIIAAVEAETLEGTGGDDPQNLT